MPSVFCRRIDRCFIRGISVRFRITRTHILISAIVIMASCTFAQQAFAKDFGGFGPISVRNQNPVYLQSLGLKPRRAEVLPEGVIEGRLDSAYSNIFKRTGNSSDFLDLDMEYWRLGINVAYGVAEDFELGIEVPIVHFNGGFLDGFIQDFHNAFGFPNGGRETVPNNRFSYRFDGNGNTIFDHSPATAGLGDITLGIKHQVTGQDSDWPAVAWFSELKLPTGRQSRGFGSGLLNFGIGAALDAKYDRIHGYCNVGYYVVGRDDALSQYQRNEMFAFMVAGEVTIIPTLAVIVQVAGSTPLLEGTNIESWNGVPMELIIGFRGEEEDLFDGGDLIWQVGFSEDLLSRGPSVDFTVFMSIGVRFDLFGRTRPVGDWLAKK
jgi:Protein of unknown function (DUF3187)